MTTAERLACDVAVIGGGLGGAAAALAACDAGVSVILTEATDWLGGQMTGQGVSALDEQPFIESFGGTAAYHRLRAAIRADYQCRDGAPLTMPDGQPLNPGNGWVSRLCFEPVVGARALEDMLVPHVEAGRLRILRGVRPVAARAADDRVQAVALAGADGRRVTVEAAIFLDATELGDLLPLTGTAYVAGAEAQADTGEALAAPDGPHPERIQSFTFPFALEYHPGEDHTIRKPHGYEHFRAAQPYSLTLPGHEGGLRHFRMFAPGAAGELPFWTYRRLRDGALLGGRDLSMINWAGNDYHGASLIDQSPAAQAAALDEAKRLSLGFLYWLQTEVPRDDGQGRGYPGLKLIPAAMGTADGLSKAPYIREARRIIPVRRVVQADINAPGSDRAGRRVAAARAVAFDDTVGVGWYHIDVHGCVGAPGVALYVPTRPFQIPLGALLPRHTRNLIAAAKNIGTTHITNGAYRVHPVEWAIGEAAGVLAALCCHSACAPGCVQEDSRLLWQLQLALLGRGVPLAWGVDVPPGHPLFVPAQAMLLAGAILPGSPRAGRLTLDLDDPPGADELTHVRAAAGDWLAAVTGRVGEPLAGESWAALAQEMARRLPV